MEKWNELSPVVKGVVVLGVLGIIAVLAMNVLGVGKTEPEGGVAQQRGFTPGH